MSSPFSDAIRFACHQCGEVLEVPRSIAGKKAQCPKCQAVQQVPAGPEGAGTAGAPTAPHAASNPVPPSHPDPSSFATPSAPVAPREVPGAPPAVAPAPSAATPGAQPAPVRTGTLPTLTFEELADESGTTPARQLFQRVIEQVARVYVGQDELVVGTLVALFSGGHVLIESVPGLGKTLFVRTLGRILGCRFGRIQFTADLMPSDVTGAPIFNMKTQEFEFRPGPVFTQLLLADEINRAPAKTHAALLEIMQEYRVTIDGKAHPIERPFLVMATQNPIESEGTYNLPEAQLDRFMFKLIVDYPGESEEAAVLEMHGGQRDVNRVLTESLECVTGPEEIMATTQATGAVKVEKPLIQYINQLVRLTRRWPHFHMGASPRAGIALMQASRTLATFCGRDYAVPDDVIRLALPVLRHRVILTAEAEVEGHSVDDLLTQLIRSVEVPRL